MYNNNTQPQDSFLLHRPALPPPNFINAYQQDVTHNRNNNTNTASTLTNTLPPILPRIAPAGPIPLPPTPQTRPRPSRPKYKIKTDKTAWTADEDNLLRLAVQLYGDRSERWTKIAACVPGRTNKMCRKRWFHSLDPNLRKGPWTEEEDDLLRKAVEKHNRVWCKVAESIPGRTDDQCAKRWKECLDPDIDHTEWTDQEDALLMQKYSEYGSQWQQIAQFFQGRPGLHCRNRWRKIQRLKKAQKDPSMDMIIITPNDITTTNSSSPHSSTSSLSTTLHSTPQNVLQPNLQSNAQSNLSTNNMQSNVQQQSNTQPHVQSRSSSIMSRQTVNLQQSHIHSNLQQQRLPLNNTSPNLSANLQSNLQPNLQSNLQSNLQPNLSSKSNLSSNYVSNYSSKSNNNVSATSLLQKMLPSNLSSNLTNNSTSSIPSSIAPPSIENNTPDTMTHLPSTSSSGPTIASLLSSPSTSVSNNQMNLDILDDQAQPQSQPSQETEVETNVKAYGCGVTGCEVSFPSANGLYYHMKAAHPTSNADKPFRCALAGCSKKYKNINGLQYHIDNAKGSSGHKYDTEEGTNDTTIKPFKCPVAGCKNNYVSANGLQYHQKNVHRKDADKYRGPHKVNSQNNQRSDDSDPQSSSHAEIDSTDTASTPSLNEQSWINNVSNDSNNQPLPVFNIFQPQFNDPEILSFNESSNFKCCHNGCGKSFNTVPELNDHVSSDHRPPMRQKRRIIPHSE